MHETGSRMKFIAFTVCLSGERGRYFKTLREAVEE